MLSELIVDGNAVTTASSYTFENVTSNHTITATFNPLVDNIISVKNNDTIIQTIKKQLDTITLSTTNTNFNEWTSNGLTLVSPKQPTQEIQMPGNSIEIIEHVKPNLVVMDGSVLETEKQVGDTVMLVATLNEGDEFGGWLAKGISIETPMSLSISFTMPDNNVELIASKHAVGQEVVIKIESEGTTIELEKQTGDIVTLTSENINNFTSWNVYGIEIENTSSDTITFIMPSNDVYIKINK